MKRKPRSHDLVDMQMTPMIDMVFLLLVFFMVSARPIKQESDIDFNLPGGLAQNEPVNLPDELMIQISDEGLVSANEEPLDPPQDFNLPKLKELLLRFRSSSDLAGSPPLVTLSPSPKTKHQRVVDVLNLCAQVGLKNVTFRADSNTDDASMIP